MNSILNGLSTINSIAGSVTNLIQDNISIASFNTPTESSQTPGSERSLPIPTSLVKEQWRLIFTADANIQDLQEAIAHCQDLVLHSEECSEERRWLVRHLVDLRYSLAELRDAQANQQQCGPLVKSIVGHHFLVNPNSGIRCDHCTGIIWSVVQQSYICQDCKFLAHQKCLDNVTRICAHVKVSERQYPIADICPEIGLAAQHYKCAECDASLHFKNSWIEPRLCDYSGLYFCPACHWNDNSIIPARIVHNWDFAPRKVARASLQEINLFLDKPLIRLEEVNPKLFIFLDKLGTIKKLRQNLVYMRKYLVECRQAMDDKILELQIGARRHLLQSLEFYSINDMEQAESGALADFLNKLYNVFDRHIRACAMCNAKAYICEICSNDEVIFPFDDGCIICDKCNSIFHRVCKTRKGNSCPKCIRLQERKQHLESTEINENDEDFN